MSRRPVLRTSLPGPMARAIIEMSEGAVSTSYTRDYPLVAAAGQGCWITDPDDNEFLDMTAGIAVTATGHCHPHVVEAIKGQADKLLHMSGTDFYYSPQATLASRLVRMGAVRGEKHRVYFGNSGAEAIEAALKLARHKTGRYGLIGFLGAFHGRTMGALSMTASKVRQRERFGPLIPGVFHGIYPDPLRHGPDATRHALEHLDNILHQLISPDEVAAVLVEPIQGEGGYIVPPDDFLPALRALCDAHGILLIYDEVQSGMGRTGSMFAWRKTGAPPDILCLAKGIASGLPLSAMLASDQIMQWPPGAHASTFGGNPLSCAAANATLDVLEAGLVEHAAIVGDHFKRRLTEVFGDHPRVAEVRGRGLMLAVELVKDRDSLERDGALRNQVVLDAFELGLLILGSGPNSIRFCPGLTLSIEEADVAVELFAAALDRSVSRSNSTGKGA